MIVADVNVLVYAFDTSSTNHERYRTWLTSALTQRGEFALVDTVLSGFVRVVTHPKIFSEPVATGDALEFVDAIIEAPASTWLPTGRATWNTMATLATADSAIRGNHIPDAYLASLALAHRARFATADRGFARYRGLDWFDPGVS